MAMLVDEVVLERHQPQMGRQCRSVDMVVDKPEMSASNQKTINKCRTGLMLGW